ncbi:aflatoxin biosynthesis ketoreductase-like protein nor-1 [Mycena olivaceomarginata]|nr:aflatoxin biosynthesis ketoreductase-like protein nor-1 [Mycena olivaceomarginata]
MSGKTVYLVSGSNRGIGHTLTASLAARPNTIVFAGARDPAAQSLKDLAAKHPNVHPVKLTSGDEADNAAAAAEIQKTAGHLDVVIANAGIAKYYGALATTPLSEFTDHWQVNTFATVVLYQAVHKLLLASPTGAPKFAYISTTGASLGAFVNFSASAYGSSKAAANYLVKALDAENPALVTLAISPGWVATDMGNAGAVAHGLPQAPLSVEDSVAGILARVDAATKETSGRFWDYKAGTGGDSGEIPW